jgi:ABC-2 type transport system ATP-binding protein
VYAIEVSNLTKRFGHLVAVDHIGFEVNKGEIFGFLGPNGAGKTTTIRMLTGMSIPTEGTAAIMGFDIQRQSVKAKEQMGIVPDISNVYNELSAWDNLIFTGRLYDVPKIYRESRAEELLKMFGLYDRRGEKVRGFSRGMKRRICIAMAMTARMDLSIEEAASLMARHKINRIPIVRKSELVGIITATDLIEKNPLFVERLGKSVRAISTSW